MVRIFYINRDVDTHRRELMETALRDAGIEAERVRGVDGYDAPDWLAKYYDRKMPPGETGCSSSHLLVYSKILEEKLPWAVVLEDDARPLPGFLGVVKDAIAKAPRDWDLIRLTRRSKWALSTVCALDGGRRLVRYVKIPPGAQGLIVSRSGAWKLLTPRTVSEPIDVEIKRPWNLNLNVFGVDPRVVDSAASAATPSTIAVRSRPRKYSRVARHAFNIQQFGTLGYVTALVKSLTGLA